MSVRQSLATALPAVQPPDPAARLLLFGLRRMGAHGLHDASAANAFLMAFGRGFQRPLVLLRALLADLSATSAGPIAIAPWCCGRMTAAEATVLRAVSCARARPDLAGLLLGDLLGVRDAGGVVASACALANAFADMALPLD